MKISSRFYFCACFYVFNFTHLTGSTQSAHRAEYFTQGILMAELTIHFASYRTVQHTKQIFGLLRCLLQYNLPVETREF